MIPRSVGTHDGTFHADEVTACALLVLFNLVDENKIFRTRALKELAQFEFVCDVGGIYNPSQKRFDHHQSDYQGLLSSAGMVLEYLKETHVIDEDLYDFFNKSLILGIDAHDNGRVMHEMGLCSFSHVISNFVPAEYDASKEKQTKAFFEAFSFTLGHLKRLLERWHYIHSCREIVAFHMKKQEKVLFFDQAIPWLESFFDLGGETHPALFIVMPSGGHWKLRGIPPSLERRMEVRCPLPLEWAGLLDQDLKKVTGISGAVFCHKGRFVSVWETKEDVLKALEKVLS